MSLQLTVSNSTGCCATNACSWYGRAKMLYSPDSFGSCRTSGDFWKRLRNLGIGKKCKTNISSPLCISPEDFNRDITDITDINHHEIVNESRRNLFYFRRVSLKETYRGIMRIKSKAERSDCVTSFFPTSWKYAIVKQLAKRTSVTFLDDFRSISILPALSKALEFLVHQQVYKYVNDSKLFDSYQSGFRTGHST
ncbi:hypothetical protein PR048_000698 [Dryococelus australis]|uniref:Reverse transcriptase n=1 Tax=Dryococelus australis TaxID=614101 RepID=A0ABQ9IFH1_9NEOP|nr:hypothetical protein PR048_000698 [Dryococelus australis]